MDHRNYSVLSFPGHHFDPQDPERRADYWIDLIESPDEELKFLVLLLKLKEKDTRSRKKEKRNIPHSLSTINIK